MYRVSSKPTEYFTVSRADENNETNIKWNINIYIYTK